jgi:hypothetical protein
MFWLTLLTLVTFTIFSWREYRAGPFAYDGWRRRAGIRAATAILLASIIVFSFAFIQTPSRDYLPRIDAWANWATTHTVRPQPTPSPTGGPDPCAGLGIIGDDRTCGEISREVERLRHADAYIAAPREVPSDKGFRLVVVIDPAKQTSRKAVEQANPGATVEMRDSRVSNYMTATIEAAPAFVAKPEFDDARKLVIPAATTSWPWSLKAAEAVEWQPNLNPVIIRLFAHIQRDGKTSAPIEVQVLRHDIAIKVSWTQALSGWVVRLDPIYKFLALLVSAVGAILTWLGLHRKILTWLALPRRLLRKMERGEGDKAGSPVAPSPSKDPGKAA